MNEAASIAAILKTSKTIAVVGLSSNRYRASNGVSRYMQSAGYRIIPVNPALTEVLGEKAYPTLESIPEKVDIVNVFRRPEYVPEIVDSAIRIGARSLWLQEEVVHEEAAGRAEQNGLAVVMDRCLLKEHQRLSHSGEL
jgi:predicted CoA-binding protein